MLYQKGGPNWLPFFVASARRLGCVMRNSRPLFLVSLAMAGLYLCCAGVAVAADPLLSLLPTEKGVFVLQGSELNAIRGIAATVHYDPATLANPRVSQGRLMAGGLLVPTTTTPGIVVIGMIWPTPITDNGPLATITFDMPGSTPGMILSFTADVINASGTKIPSQVQIVTPGATLPEVDQLRERLEPPPPPMPTADPNLPATTGETTQPAIPAR